MAKAPKTQKANATIGADLISGHRVEYARGASTGQWFMRFKMIPDYEAPYRTAWKACDDPTVAMEISPSRLLGDVDFHTVGEYAGLPGVDGHGRARNAFVCGDIGHRLRLPR